MLLNRDESGARLPAGLRPAVPADRDTVLDLLAAADLPVAGISPELEGFVVAVRGTEVVGAGGLEPADGDALLRSLVVRADERGNGTGEALVARLLADARQRGVGTIWLLTETAAPLFARFGFRQRTRADAPEAIRATVEFASCCPASAVVMSRRATPLRVLVLCTANAARSQIAEALLQHTLGDQVIAASAGTSPGNGPHPLAVAVLAERGIEWVGMRSKSIEEAPGSWDLVITVCDSARESCPVLPGARTIHWGLPDPAGKGIEEFRAVADELDRRIGVWEWH